MLQFEFSTFVSAHSSLNMSLNQKKISCVVMPNNPVLASVGDDETLRFWDLTKKQIIVSKYLGAQAVSLAFSPDGAYLIVGLMNGVLLVLEAKIQKLNFGSFLEEFSIPSLDVKMCPKEAKAAIIATRFSYRGDYLAVSFNNEYREGNH
jgi:WD40 repeat protein